MKKLLIPILCGLLAVASCNMSGSFQAQNMTDIVTVDHGLLVNDNGVAYTLVETVGKDIPTLQEGLRYYVLFDILNQELDICLTNAMAVKIVNPTPVPEDLDEITAHDPVFFQFNTVGPRYWDMGILTYKAIGSNYAHNISVYYKVEDNGQNLHLYVFHDGNDENPVKMSSNDLASEATVISIPLSAFKDVDIYTLTCDVLTNNTATGEYEIVRRTI
jgi:hypothetical protein